MTWILVRLVMATAQIQKRGGGMTRIRALAASVWDHLMDLRNMERSEKLRETLILGRKQLLLNNTICPPKMVSIPYTDVRAGIRVVDPWRMRMAQGIMLVMIQAVITVEQHPCMTPCGIPHLLLPRLQINGLINGPLNLRRSPDLPRQLFRRIGQFLRA